MEKLTMQEGEVTIYIWELESYYTEDIVVEFEQPVPPYTTVASIVKNLERKKYAKTQRVGDAYLYTLATKESEYKRSSMSGVVRSYFENSHKETISFFAKDREVPINDPREIIDMIEKGEEN